MATYEHKVLGRRITYEVTGDSVVSDARSLLSTNRTSAALDQFPHRSRVVTTSSRSWFLWAVGTGLLAALFLVLSFSDSDFIGAATVFGLGAGFTGGVWYVSRRCLTVFDFPGGGAFAFEAPKHPWPPLEEFLTELQRAKLAALQRKLEIFAIDSEPQEVARYLIWLRDAGYVDDEGLLELRNALEAQNRRGPTGFVLGDDVAPA